MRPKENSITCQDVRPSAWDVKKHLFFNILSARDERKQCGETSQGVGKGKNTSKLLSQGLGTAENNVRRHPKALGREKTKVADYPRAKKDAESMNYIYYISKNKSI